MQPKKLQPEPATHEGTPLAQLLRQPLKLFDATVRPAQREDPEDAWFNEGGATMWPAPPRPVPVVAVDPGMTFGQYKEFLNRQFSSDFDVLKRQMNERYGQPPRIRRICPLCGDPRCNYEG